MKSAETISVIAGGWSAGSRGNAPRGIGTIIGVNDSAIWARCQFAVSMDRLWTEHRWPMLKARKEQAVLSHAHIRSAALKNIVERPYWLHPFECDYTSTVPSDLAQVLNGTNSGMCALNLAYQMRPARILLFGFDMNRSPDGRVYWHGDYPWSKPGGATTGGKYIAWSQQFSFFAVACRKAKIEVLNTSMTSAITEFRKVALESLL